MRNLIQLARAWKLSIFTRNVTKWRRGKAFHLVGPRSPLDMWNLIQLARAFTQLNERKRDSVSDCSAWLCWTTQHLKLKDGKLAVKSRTGGQWLTDSLSGWLLVLSGGSVSSLVWQRMSDWARELPLKAYLLKGQRHRQFYTIQRRPAYGSHSVFWMSHLAHCMCLSTVICKLWSACCCIPHEGEECHQHTNLYFRNCMASMILSPQ